MSNILVAYFSASGTTEKVAQKLASQIHADLFKIQPKQAYTRADLNWNDSHSRSTLEMKDPNSRPEILNKVEKMEQYNAVFVGLDENGVARHGHKRGTATYGKNQSFRGNIEGSDPLYPFHYKG